MDKIFALLMLLSVLTGVVCIFIGVIGVEYGVFGTPVLNRIILSSLGVCAVSCMGLLVTTNENISLFN